MSRSDRAQLISRLQLNQGHATLSTGTLPSGKNPYVLKGIQNPHQRRLSGVLSPRRRPVPTPRPRNLQPLSPHITKRIVSPPPRLRDMVEFTLPPGSATDRSRHSPPHGSITDRSRHSPAHGSITDRTPHSPLHGSMTARTPPTGSRTQRTRLSHHRASSQLLRSTFTGSPQTRTPPKQIHVHGKDLSHIPEFKNYINNPNSLVSEFTQIIVENEELWEDFWYFNNRGKPYSFELVDFDKRSPEQYLTVSSRGVTHYIYGEGTFYSLEDWNVEESFYISLKQIKFFEKYKTWKQFLLWKNLRRRSMMNQVKSTLEKNVFTADGLLRQPILDIRSLLYKASRWDLVDLSLEMVHTLDQFYELQEKKRSQILEQLEIMEHGIFSIIQASTNNSIWDFRYKYNIREGDYASIEMPEDEEPFLIGDGSHKPMPYTQSATMRRHYQRLAKYIRLCDYLYIDCKVLLSFATAKKVLKTISTYRKGWEKKQLTQTLPLFELRAIADGVNVEFQPTLAQMKHCIENSVIKGVDLLCSDELLSHRSEFITITDSVEVREEYMVEDEIDVLSQVIKNKNFASILNQTTEGVTSSFQKIVDFCTGISSSLETYEQNEKIDFEVYKSFEAEHFKFLISQFQKQKAKFTAIPQTENIGIFQINFDDIKNLILPSPDRCIARVNRIIPQLVYKRSVETTRKLIKSNQRLSSLPLNIDQYIQYDKYLHLMNDNIDQYTVNCGEIKDLVYTMEMNEIKFDEGNKSQFAELITELKKLKSTIQEANDKSENNRIRFTKELKGLVSNVDKEVKIFKNKLDDDIISNKEADPSRVLQYLSKIGEKVEVLNSQSKAYIGYQNDIEIERTNFDDVWELRIDYKIKLDLWTSLYEWDDKFESWKTASFAKIDVNSISEEVEKSYKIAQRAKTLEEEGNLVPMVLRTKVAPLRNTMPVVIALRDPLLKERHWDAINEVLGCNIDTYAPNFTLKKLLKMQVDVYREELQEIALKANKEDELERQMKDVVNSWEDVEFQLKNYKDHKDIWVFTELDKIIEQLDDTNVALTSIITNRFIGPLWEIVEPHQKKFKLFSSNLEAWMNVQKQWMYLENIFHTQDIQKQLPSETKKFNQVDFAFRSLMTALNTRPYCVPACTRRGLAYELSDWNTKLEQIQRALEDYLDRKRRVFPRFYFLSNNELLEILSRMKTPSAILPFLRKCFEGIYFLEFDKFEDIIAMKSQEGETVTLSRNLKSRGNVEDWLGVVEQDMQKSLRREMKLAYQEYEEDPADRAEWTKWFPSQVVATVSQVMWCMAIEEALNGQHDAIDALDEQCHYTKDQLHELIKMIRGQLNDVERRRIVALITQDVHNRDIVERLRDEEVSSSHDFRWQQQLRYLWNSELDEVYIQQVNAEFIYGHEFLGATTRLVITPLTDRCWITITGALHIKLGASPAGPAGTGKTESTKDLAKALGVFCVVFNCSEQIKYQLMEKLFTGLCSSGSWACLDEFNRIDIEVLSVIAQQLMTIRNAKLESREEFYLDDKLTHLEHTMGVFVTMNPGYAGRTELPDNLKVLFRPVSMMVPDYTQIAEIMLFAEGFVEAKPLSGKMSKLYKLSSEQLSQQDHYDFGMRAVKSVLNMAGALKRKNPDMEEDVVLIRAMRDSNVPKFLKEDLILFKAIISDLFPGVKVPYVNYGELKDSIDHVIVESGLQQVEAFMMSAIQLFETFQVRFGVMLVGPATGGKTSCYTVLADALTHLRTSDSRDLSFKEVQKVTLNPKSISMGELFGDYNEYSGDWSDGLASYFMRQFSEQEDDKYRWVIFDGPVDALWIENMNTVLDDNMMLCLANSERIMLRQNMRMLFEVQDLAYASPATVSRCGMVYIKEQTIGWQPYVKSWISRELSEWDPLRTDYLWCLFDAYVPKALKYIRKQLHQPIGNCSAALVIGMCSLLKSLFSPANNPRLEDDIDFYKRTIEKIFAFAFIWGLGGGLDDDSSYKFDNFVTNQLDFDLPKGSLYDCYIDNVKPCSRYLYWDQNIPPFSYSKNKSFFEMIVPTKDSVRFSYLLRRQLEVGKPVFVTGETGVGKTLIITDTLTNMKRNDNVHPVFLSFSARTSSLQAQNSIVGKLESKRKDLLGAPAGKSTIIMIDDINMPQTEEFGAQPPIELIRQFVDQGYFYDRDSHNPIRIQNCNIITCAAPPSGGRNPITPRMVRHFHVLSIPSPSEQSMIHIFKSIVSGFFANFKQEVLTLSTIITSSTILLYYKITQELLPIPIKSHYTFNLRDVAKVFQGMLMINSSMVNSAYQIIRLWIHETSRVFHDRLINAEDRLWFTQTVSKMVMTAFRKDWTHEELFEGHHGILFGDFMRGEVEEEDKLYEEITDHHKLRKMANRYLDSYNDSGSTQMHLVFFHDALVHLCRICRILRLPRGNAVLIGVGGSGKQSLTRLASHINNASWFQIQVSRTYNFQSFRDDIKKVFLQSGGTEAKPTTFLFTDSQIPQESFLEDINNILNSGEVPNLFTNEELEQIEQDMRPIAAKAKVYDEMYAYFISRVRQNLHVVLCMSPMGDQLRVRMRMFPSLVNCCTINWVDPWPEDALLSVAKNKMKDLELSDMTLEEADVVRENLAIMCKEIHLSVREMSEDYFRAHRRKIYITPKSFLDLMNLFFSLLATKRHELYSQKMRFVNGVQTLVNTNEEVKQLQIELTALKPIIEQKKKESEELTIKVEIEATEANQVKEEAQLEERLVDGHAKTIKQTQESAAIELAKALPTLEAAIEALGLIDKGNISEIKTFPNPPVLVKFTLEAVMILLNEKTDWESIKRVLSNLNFLDRLKSYEKDSVTPSILKRLRTKIRSNTDFTPEEVGKKNKASESLCAWVFAMDSYSRIKVEVEPKMELAKQMSIQMNEANKKLSVTRARLQDELEKVKILQDQLYQCQGETERLNYEQIRTSQRLERASVLTESLKEEGIRWESSVVKLSERVSNILGDIFISASCINYYGPFSADYRRNLVEKWISSCNHYSVPITSGYTLEDTIVNPMIIRDWNLQSLPSDEVSINNGILVTQSERWPLMIDPQEQASRWIRILHQNHNIKVVRMNDRDIIRVLENGIKNGIPILVEDIGETIDSALNPILCRSLIPQGAGHYSIRIGSQDIDYDENFLLYFTTKLPNPHYLPEVTIHVNLINFTVTQEGLQEQILADVVKHEKPEVEQENFTIMQSIANDSKRLTDIESDILESISVAYGNILDKTELIGQLWVSKYLSQEIAERMHKSEESKQRIEEARGKYKSIATRGSILYFVIADLAFIDPMYQYSLQYFVRLFNRIMETSEKGNNLESRIEILLDKTTEIIFSNVCRGLFNAHKLIFGFIIAVKVLQNSGDISAEEFSVLLKGAPFIPPDFSLTENPCPSLFSAETWDMVQYIQNVSAPFSVHRLGELIANNLEEWQEWIDLPNPQDSTFPCGLNYLPAFHKLLLIRTFREEKTTFSVIQFVQESIGDKYVTVKPTSMSEVFAESTNTTPIIFILSQGGDPNSQMRQFAEEKGYLEKLDIISLGQGQRNRAERFILNGFKTGNWVMLQNWHLYKSWMPELEKIVRGMDESPSSRISADFRLFLTSMPVDYFPVPILQNGVKLTNEPPKGIRTNVLKSLSTISDEKLNDCVNPQAYKQLLFSLCFFHSIVQERRKFGPLGWNIRYEFNESDLETSITMLKNFLDEHGDRIPWDAITFMVGEINYGGRVTDELDRRTLSNILSIYISPDVLNEHYSFSESGTYYIPEVDNMQGFLSYIESLPLSDEPEIFGMHENANIACQKQESVSLISAVLNIQPRDKGNTASGKSSDEIVDELAEKILDKIPPHLSKSDAFRGTFKKDKNGLMDSLSTFLGQEMVRFNRLLTVIKMSLEDLRRAIAGQITMSRELDEMYSSFITLRVPSNWSRVAYPSLKPLLAWVSDLLQRVVFIQSWLSTGKPIAYWIPAFFFPQGFLTAVQQSYSRKYFIPIDILGFDFEIQPYADKEQVEESLTDGVHIYGLYMDSCKWDMESMEIVDSIPGQIYAPAPVISFIPKEQIPQRTSTGTLSSADTYYSMPVYKTSVRAGTLSTTGHSTNFIISIDMPTSKTVIAWILKGAAFVCQLDN